MAVELRVIRVFTLHLSDSARQKSTSDSVEDKQQISETSVSPAIADTKQELFMSFYTCRTFSPKFTGTTFPSLLDMSRLKSTAPASLHCI